MESQNINNDLASGLAIHKGALWMSQNTRSLPDLVRECPVHYVATSSRYAVFQPQAPEP
jgi:hypothetical protein